MYEWFISFLLKHYNIILLLIYYQYSEFQHACGTKVSTPIFLDDLRRASTERYLDSLSYRSNHFRRACPPCLELRMQLSPNCPGKKSQGVYQCVLTLWRASYLVQLTWYRAARCTPAYCKPARKIPENGHEFISWTKIYEEFQYQVLISKQSLYFRPG